MNLIFLISFYSEVLFQENEAGCWVTRVFRSGNAAKNAQGDGIKVGDQLASVNGQSTFQMKIDEACAMISSSSYQGAVELTFVRYIGKGNQTRHNVKRNIATKKRSGHHGKKNGTAHCRESDKKNILNKSAMKIKSRKSKVPPPPPPQRNQEQMGLHDLNQSKVPYVDVRVNEKELEFGAPKKHVRDGKSIQAQKSQGYESEITKGLDGHEKASKSGGGNKNKLRTMLGRFKKKKK